MVTTNNRVISNWNFSQRNFWRLVKSDWGIEFSKYSTAVFLNLCETAAQ